MSETNKLFDPFVANASAAFYGVENQAVVEENFPALYEKMVESFKGRRFMRFNIRCYENDQAVCC